MKNNMLVIDKKAVGAGQSCYIIAEAGSNHNGDFETAKRLIEVAAEAGADAVKFQAFKAEHHYSKFTPGFTYLHKSGITLSTYDLIRSVEINREWHQGLMEYAAKCGITFFSSPCDQEAIMQLHSLGVPAFKVASFDLPDLELIKFIAALNKPIILSTGMADYADIQAAVNACESVGNNQVALLQCTSLYPAPVHVTNLQAIRTMQQAFGYVIGYSDHTLGDHISLAAVTLGAKMIEKHFTIDRNLPGPDHKFAIEPLEFKAMIQRIRDIEAAMGDGIKKGPSLEEKEMFEKGRRSVHLKKDIKAGQVITKEDLVTKRPGYGISPRLIEKVVGMTAEKDVQADYWLTWEDLKEKNI